MTWKKLQLVRTEPMPGVLPVPWPPPARNDPPPLDDPLSDRQIPARVYSAWKEEFGGRPRALVRPLTSIERDALTHRKVALEGGLLPFEPEENDHVEALITLALNGFRVLYKARDEEADATVEAIRHLLSRFPLWAIAETVDRIRNCKAGLSASYATNDPEFVLVTERIVAPYLLRLQAVTELLAAPVEPDLEYELAAARKLAADQRRARERAEITAIRERYGVPEKVWNEIPDAPRRRRGTSAPGSQRTSN
jgi:hypothetical protein